MSFETGTATGVGDLYVKWFNFLQANGWTADVDWASASQSPSWGIIQRKVNQSPTDETTVHLQCAFCIAADGAGGVKQTSMIPMRDYISGDPEDAVDVATSASSYTNSGQHVEGNFPSEPFENYWFFESDFYAYAVVEYATGFFRHFGMGSINKIGKWIGGDFYYNGMWDQNVSDIDNPLDGNHSVMMDSMQSSNASGPVMYGIQMDGQSFPDLIGRQSPQSIWHGVAAFGDAGFGLGTDAAGRDRGGLYAQGPRIGFSYPFNWIGRVPFNGYRMMNPMMVYTWYTGSNPDNYIPLGGIPDVRSISMMDDLLPGDEFTVGSDTWIVFPVVRRKPLQVLDNTEQSLSFGVAYKKVLT